MLQDFEMWEFKPVAIPIDRWFTKATNNYNASQDFCLRYQSVVGSLMYAMLGTCSDFAFAVSVISCFASNPNESHLLAVKCIFCYIKRTLDLQLLFRRLLSSLTGYTDADWADNHDTQRSTSGFVFNIRSSAISWSSKHQLTVAFSTCKVEYIS